MKKIIGLFILFFALNACNDGDVVVQDISLDSIAGVACGKNMVYKINGNLVLMLNITQNDTAFNNKVTKPLKPRIYQINSTNSLTYRAYNGAVNGNNICGYPNSITEANINLVEEWKATSGTIEITTTAIKTIDATTNTTKITGYNHTVYIKNLVFHKPTGDQNYELFSFGSYTTSYSNNLFSFGTVLNKCATTTALSNRIGFTDLITLDNNPNLIQNAVTPTGSPRVGNINTTNKLVYRVFKSLDATNFECRTTFVATDALQETWTATSGTYEVTTIANGGSTFKHTIVLKNVVLSNGNVEINLGNSYTFGEIVTP